MEIAEILSLVGSLVNTVGIPALGGLLYVDSRRRAEAAKAKQAEAEARAAEEDNITSYAAEWKELFEKEERRVSEFKAEVQRLNEQVDEDRKRIREMQAEIAGLKIEAYKATQWKCEVKMCPNRVPPTGL